MKKLLVFFLTMVLAVSQADAQKAKKTASKPDEPAATQPQTQAAPPSSASILGEHFARKYSVAQRWGDYEVAKDALFDLIAEFPGSDSLLFTLAYYYYENQKYPSCAMVCTDLLARSPKHAGALELSGVSYENLNIKDKALQSFESLFLLTNDNATLYKMASLQYDLKRYQEVLTNADILLSKPEATTLHVVFNDAQNKPKEYVMKAALFNLKGLAYKAQADKENAKKAFEEALKVVPDFDAAKQNLASLK